MERSKNSLLYWFPKIKDLGIPVPKTEAVLLTSEEIDYYYNGEGDCFNLNRLTIEAKETIKQGFKLPVFLRTDEYSHKHFWNKSCYLDNLNNLQEHLGEIIIGSRLAGGFGNLGIEAIAIREFIPMDTRFFAFSGQMPVNPERRYFIRDRKVICHHPYWIEDAIEKGIPKRLPSNWREILRETNLEDPEEIFALSEYSRRVAKIMPEFWSIDYCKAKDRRWILIDIAEGERSWHPEENSDSEIMG